VHTEEPTAVRKLSTREKLYYI